MSEARWQDQANCRGLAPTDGKSTHPFFGERGSNNGFAKAVCQGCQVRETCLEEHLHERFGFWGGLPERDRRKLRQARERAVALQLGDDDAGRGLRVQDGAA